MESNLSTKAKAKEIIEKFMFSSIYFTNGIDGAKLNAKTCAAISVNEIINNDGFTQFDDYLTAFWFEVLKEIKQYEQN